MELSELGVTPISDDKPAGDDARYEPEFEELQQEIDKLSIATASGGPIDWNKVISLCQTILSEKSKDLQVATYLAAALIETQKLAGMIDGLKVLKDLIENFWDSLFPPKKRMRGRLNAVNWWYEKAEDFLKNFEPDPLPPEQVEQLKNNINELDETLSSKSDDAPVLSRLLDYIERFPVQAPEPEPEATPAEGEAPAPEPAAQAAPAEKKAPAQKPAAAAPKAEAAPVEKVESSRDADTLIDFGLGQLTKAAAFLRGQNLADARSYRLTRVAAWLTVDAPPPASGGATQLPPPESYILTSLNTQMSSQDYAGVIQTAEGYVTQYLFWLDLSRFTAQALEALGGAHQAAADALAMDAAVYVKRLPSLPNLSFSDGTPFADRETKAWLKRIALDQPADAPAAGPSSGAEAKAAEAYDQAQKLLKEKKEAEAVGLLEDQMHQGAAGRDRMTWRIALARLLLDMARPELAQPHFDEILREIDVYRLEAFDPRLTIEGLLLIHEGLKDSKDEAVREKGAEVMARIARLSPKKALSLSM